VLCMVANPVTTKALPNDATPVQVVLGGGQPESALGPREFAMRFEPLVRWTCALGLLACLACGDSSTTETASFPKLEAGCQPLLGGHHCLLPFPSDYFRVEDPQMETGFRVAITGSAASITDDGENAELTSIYDTDGFSRLPLVVGALPDVLVPDGLVDILSDYSQTLSPSSKTIIINTSTGEFIPHFADVDPRAYDDDRRAVALHTVTDLDEQTRYVVVLQGIQNESGEDAASGKRFEFFKTLRNDASVVFQ
jgi:hypothetical protein